MTDLSIHTPYYTYCYTIMSNSDLDDIRAKAQELMDHFDCDEATIVIWPEVTITQPLRRI